MYNSTNKLFSRCAYASIFLSSMMHAATPFPDAQPHVVPGTIEAEYFDAGENGESYYDNTDGNSGNSSRRNNDVDIENSLGNVTNIGWIAADEWWEYTINVSSSGTYNLTAQVASNTEDGSIAVSVNDISQGNIDFNTTNNWYNWQSTASLAMHLTSGTHVIRLTANTHSFNIDSFSLLHANTLPSQSGAFPDGIPHSIPGQVEFEDFDIGLNGESHFDTTAANVGPSNYRNTAVDMESRLPDVTNIGWVRSNEWWRYTIRIETAGTYGLSANVASSSVAGEILFSLLDQNITQTISFETTGGWQNWHATTPVEIQLPSGEFTLEVEALTASINLDYFTLTLLEADPPTHFGPESFLNLCSACHDTDGSGTASVDSLLGDNCLACNDEQSFSQFISASTTHQTLCDAECAHETWQFLDSEIRQ